MDEIFLTGAQRSHLRGLGQKLDPALKLGRGGLTPEFLRELRQELQAHELVKLRFLSADRAERPVRGDRHPGSLCVRGCRRAHRAVFSSAPRSGGAHGHAAGQIAGGFRGIRRGRTESGKAGGLPLNLGIWAVELCARRTAVREPAMAPRCLGNTESNSQVRAIR